MMIVELIRNFVKEHDNYGICENYSGKGTSGRNCIGIVVSQGDSYMQCLTELTRYLDNQQYDDADFRLEGISVDETGSDYIVYFPNIEV